MDYPGNVPPTASGPNHISRECSANYIRTKHHNSKESKASLSQHQTDPLKRPETAGSRDIFMSRSHSRTTTSHNQLSLQTPDIVFQHQTEKQKISPLCTEPSFALSGVLKTGSPQPISFQMKTPPLNMEPTGHSDTEGTLSWHGGCHCWWSPSSRLGENDYFQHACSRSMSFGGSYNSPPKSEVKGYTELQIFRFDARSINIFKSPDPGAAKVWTTL